MANIARHHCSTNLIGLSSRYIASHDFNQKPQALHISGVRESATSLFSCVAQQNDRQSCGSVFQDYMNVIFGYETEQRLKDQAAGIRRYRNSYLKLIQDWGMDSNNAQGAVFKGWVESRFGLFPTFHKQNIATFISHEWMTYMEEKMNSRYHNNCIYMQLDLLFEFCQWVIGHFRYPAEQYITLYRGINCLDENLVIEDRGKQEKVVRFNNIVSFTSRRSIASEFGAYILEVKVPVVKLIFFNELLPRHALHGESEFLVIGGSYRVKVLY